MNKIAKTIVALFVGIVLAGGSAAAQQHLPAQPAPAPQAAEPGCQAQCPAPRPDGPQSFQTNQSCFLPQLGAYVVIDSIDCSVDLLVRDGSEIKRVGRYTTDIFMGRHDLKNILRPVSVSTLGHCIVVLSSNQKDSSNLAFIPMCPYLHGQRDTMEPAELVGFNNTSYAFYIDMPNNEIQVMGKNSVGYDINVLNFGGEQIVKAAEFHYHVPKQSERILASDSKGVGLTVVAVAVVFFALICICFIMKGYGSLIMSVQDRKKNKHAKKDNQEAPAKTKDVAGEVYAAIAAAIYAYDQDLHDEEDTVITIQKVERAWTPWNAKFYNMNKYFANRK